MAATSSLQKNQDDYPSANGRDGLAETFIKSFFGTQGQVAKTVQRGLSSYFELDCELRHRQEAADELLAKIGHTAVDDPARRGLLDKLDAILDDMLNEQARTAQVRSC